MFKRKVSDELKDWKENYAPKYSTLLEGARRVGNPTVAEEFAKNNFRSYITIAAINEAKDIMAGKVEAKSYGSARELFDELDTEYYIK